MSGPTKIDGTADMRYLANRTQGFNKDDSIDKRYKGSSGNSSASISSIMSQSTSFSGPCKKDGTPDMRYAANKK